MVYWREPFGQKEKKTVAILLFGSEVRNRSLETRDTEVEIVIWNPVSPYRKVYNKNIKVSK